jgi:hypothetical protein
MMMIWTGIRSIIVKDNELKDRYRMKIPKLVDGCDMEMPVSTASCSPIFSFALKTSNY